VTTTSNFNPQGVTAKERQPFNKAMTTLVTSLNKKQAAMTRRQKTGGLNCHDSQDSAIVAKEGRSTQEEIRSLLEANKRVC
jgi:hypothetical protein